MVYKPKKAYGGLLGLVMGIVMFSFAIWGINYSLGEAADRALRMMLLVPTYMFAVVYAYLVIGAFFIRYKIEDNALVIAWGLHRKKIAWSDINEIIDVKGRANLFPLLATSWNGYMYGVYSARGLGTLRMISTVANDGFICLKTKRGMFGITPEDPAFLSEMVSKAKKAAEIVDMDQMDPETYGKAIHKDEHFALFVRLNQVFLIILAGLVFGFALSTGAPKIIVLLLVLALALYVFNSGNAHRLYQFSPTAADATLLLALMVNGIFIILSVVGIWFM